MLDDGKAFTGDLAHPNLLAEEDLARESWRRLYARGATRIYPAHGPSPCTAIPVE